MPLLQERIAIDRRLIAKKAVQFLGIEEKKQVDAKTQSGPGGRPGDRKAISPVDDDTDFFLREKRMEQPMDLAVGVHCDGTPSLRKKKADDCRRQGGKKKGKDKGRKDRLEAMLSERQTARDEGSRDFQSAERRLGKKILEIDGISKGYDGRTLFSGFSFSFVKGQKIALIGDNGSGKSTFLDIIAGHTEPDEGSIDRGINTFFGYYDQLGRNLSSSKTVLEYTEDIGKNIAMGDGEIVSASRFLEFFGFPVSMQRTPISLLSGGERRRLYLITRLASNPNFLLFDEPTNDLDIETMEKLEAYITAFPGCAIISSHDRTFLDMTTEMTLSIEDGSIRLFPGSYSAWKEARLQEEEEPSPSPAPQKAGRSQRERKGLSYKEKKEKEALEQEIVELEALIKKLEESFSTPDATELGTLHERTLKYEEAKNAVEAKTERWMELEELDG